MSDPEGKPVGAVAGRYAIERELGRGGSAIVYLARDLQESNGDARVALKLLHQEFSGSKAAERFALEVRLLREFEHPHILPVTDAGEWEGRPFYVMPYVDGESLQGRLKRERRLPFNEVVRIGRRLCEALAYAHERKVVHRDVKPANVMLAGDAVYLTDFGVAKALEPIAGAPHSTTGVARGTRAYMSPEQVVADRDLDHRSDIFSLGCVLYEMIAGVRPFYSADEARELMRRLLEPPDPLKRHRDGVPEGLEAVVVKALAREPADRWQEVGEMGRGLGGAGVASSGRRSRARNLALTGALGTTAIVWVWSILTRETVSSLEPCSVAPLATVSSPRIAVAVTSDSVSRQPPLDTRGVGLALSLAAARWLGASSQVSEEPWPAPTSDAQVACGLLGAALDMQLTVLLLPMRTSDVVSAEMRLTTQVGTHSWQTLVDSHRLREPVTWAPILRAGVARQLGAFGAAEIDTTVVAFQAWRDCVRGMASLDNGRLDSAGTFFRAALGTAPNYGCPHFGQAVVLALIAPRAIAEWREAAARVLALGGARSKAEERIATSLVDRAASQFTTACAAPSPNTPGLASAHISLLLAAECLRVDSSVVRGKSGALAFQSSWMESRRLLLRALATATPGFARLVLPRLALVSPTAPSVRWGWLPGESTASLAAYPEWEGDSLAHRPRGRRLIENAESGVVPTTLGIAVLQGKQLQSDVASGWVSRAPRSAAAHFAFALALELQGRLYSANSREPSALGELRLASAAQEESVAADSLLEVRARVLLKTWRLDELDALVDSALAKRSKADDGLAEITGSLALLQGRISDAIPLLERTLWRDAGVPMSSDLRSELTELSALAAIGCCTARLERLDASIRRRMQLEFDSTTRSDVVRRIMPRVTSLSASCRGWTPVLTLDDFADFLVKAQRRVALGDPAGARSILEAVEEARVHASSADVAVDYLAQEALVLRAIGDDDGARRRVESWRLTWSVNSALDLRQIAQAGAIGRLALLTEELTNPDGGGLTNLSGAVPRASDLWRKGDTWLVQSVGPIGSIKDVCDANPQLVS